MTTWMYFVAFDFQHTCDDNARMDSIKRKIAIPPADDLIPAIHVWVIDLQQFLPQINTLEKYLNQEEKNIAYRFHFLKDRQNYTITHALLRLLLADYLKCIPTHIQLGHHAHGKPYVLIPASSVHFNISHSQQHAAIALTQDHPIGIDIEYHRPVEHLDLAQRFFHPREYERLCQLPTDQQLNAFYGIWTCKEAFIKATGEGLSYGLNRFEVNHELNHPARFVSIDHQSTNHWQLHRFTPQENFSGAIAWEGPVKKIFFHHETPIKIAQ
ncbi:MAG: hypothetical protein A2103_02795 [Gammaproteobacteria bacterium GWF2_41_13]|nr:MAG: hypothetical protein A2103_02795 [Gammaproteobacteria bacterium GWF2_41_13]